MGKDGGTQLWCPACKDLQVCRVVTDSVDSEDRGNRYYTENPQLKSFRRPRECTKCGHFFWTDEVAHAWINVILEKEIPVDPYSLRILQEKIDDFANERDWQQFHTVKNLILALTGEVGELAEVVQWRTDNEIQDELSKNYFVIMTEENKESFRFRFEEELADIFIYLLRLSSVADVDLIKAAKFKMQKNQFRYSVEKSKGNAKKQ
jgi:dCTP diphosphatase